jgi:phosphatidylglycerophosphate synthase
MAALFALILHYPYASIDFLQLGTILIWVAAIITVASGFSYYFTFFSSASSTTA